jgi:hypothetical protein
MILDKDFQNWTLLKIITSCKFRDILSEEDQKGEFFLNKLYLGEQASVCDGNILGYSILMNLLT